MTNKANLKGNFEIENELSVIRKIIRHSVQAV